MPRPQQTRCLAGLEVLIPRQAAGPRAGRTPRAPAGPTPDSEARSSSIAALPEQGKQRGLGGDTKTSQEGPQGQSGQPGPPSASHPGAAPAPGPSPGQPLRQGPLAAPQGRVSAPGRVGRARRALSSAQPLARAALGRSLPRRLAQPGAHR